MGDEPEPPVQNGHGKGCDVRSLDYDFRIHDAYVAFSAEIVRLALLAPAALSFLTILAGKEGSATDIRTLILRGGSWFTIGLILLFIAVLSGLFHRYMAAESMTAYIEFLRDKSKKAYEVPLKRSLYAITVAPVCLAAGALCLIAGLGAAIACPLHSNDAAPAGSDCCCCASRSAGR